MKVGGLLDRAWPWLVTPALLVSECGCMPPRTAEDIAAEKVCLDKAAGEWRAAVANCAIEGKDATECELEKLTAERKRAEEECV